MTHEEQIQALKERFNRAFKSWEDEKDKFEARIKELEQKGVDVYDKMYARIVELELTKKGNKK